MPTPRQTLAKQIHADNPTFKVLDYPFTPANVEEAVPVVSVWRSDIEPGSKRLTLGHSLQVNVYGSRTAGAKAENELDDLADAVLLSIERLPGWKFTKATRATFKDTLAGWEILVTAESENVYRQTILREGK